MEHELTQTIALLERTPAALNALLRDLPEIWTLRVVDSYRGIPWLAVAKR